MKATIKRQFKGGELIVEVEGKDLIETLSRSTILMVDDYCNICKATGDSIKWESNKAQGFTFVKRRCLKCGAQSNLGTYKDGGYFWKAFEEWKKEGTQGDQPTKYKDSPDFIPPSPDLAQPEVTKDDIPF